MKVLHVCLSNFYIDDYSYQENLLTKHHKLLGHDVSIIASLVSFDSNGNQCLLAQPSQYVNENGIPVCRVNYKRPFRKINQKLRKYEHWYNILEEKSPDIIFVHGCQFLDMKWIVKYAKDNPKVRIYVDNHADYSNSANNWIIENIGHKFLWRKSVQAVAPYVKKFYGVLPARVDFLADMYKMPRNKIVLLVMGADDELVVAARQPHIRQSIRTKYNIGENDFLIMTGGKIDKNKTQTLLLMEAVQRLSTTNVKLMVFGSVSNDLRDDFHQRLCSNVVYAGWIPSQQTYAYFSAADLVVFPGLHSVLWEQVVGLGQPCIFRYMAGFTHVDLGGNCEFLYEDSVDEIQHKIQNLIDNRTKYAEMKRVALERGMDVFSYRSIAARSIEVG